MQRAVHATLRQVQVGLPRAVQRIRRKLHDGVDLRVDFLNARQECVDDSFCGQFAAADALGQLGGCEAGNGAIHRNMNP